MCNIPDSDHSISWKQSSYKNPRGTFANPGFVCGKVDAVCTSLAFALKLPNGYTVTCADMRGPKACQKYGQAPQGMTAKQACCACGGGKRT